MPTARSHATPAYMLPIDPTWSVNELLRRHPAALPVLNAHGIDTCCGGARALTDAAVDAHADLAALLADLDAAASAEARA